MLLLAQCTIRSELHAILPEKPTPTAVGLFVRENAENAVHKMILKQYKKGSCRCRCGDRAYLMALGAAQWRAHKDREADCVSFAWLRRIAWFWFGCSSCIVSSTAEVGHVGGLSGDHGVSCSTSSESVMKEVLDTLVKRGMQP